MRESGGLLEVRLGNVDFHGHDSSRHPAQDSSEAVEPEGGGAEQPGRLQEDCAFLPARRALRRGPGRVGGPDQGVSGSTRPEGAIGAVAAGDHATFGGAAAFGIEIAPRRGAASVGAQNAGEVSHRGSGRRSASGRSRDDGGVRRGRGPPPRHPQTPCRPARSDRRHDCEGESQADHRRDHGGTRSQHAGSAGGIPAERRRRSSRPPARNSRWPSAVGCWARIRPRWT